MAAKATQDFVPVREVRDGIMLLRDNSMRAVLMASSLNFALKSEDEQQSILYQFQNFLNSLDFSVQFFIESRPLDIRPYITLLEERLSAQTDDLMRIQIREYIEFVRNFTDNTDIMSKSFFLVVPYSPTLLGKKKFSLGGLFGGKGKEEKEAASRSFEENRTQLQQRVGVVEQGLTRTGVRVVQLGSEEVTELLYKLFNPGELEKPIPLNHEKQ